jgi:hypothetical protein
MSMKEKLNKPIDEIEVDDEMVLAAAKDINETLKPNPLLDLEKAGEELQKEIEDLFDNILEGDKLSEDTWKILKALGWKSAESPKIEKQGLPENKLKTEKKETKKEKLIMKPIKEKKEGKGNLLKEAFLKLMERKKPVKAEIIEVLKGKGFNESSVRTLISDSKNPKYNKFPSQLVEKEGILSFKK